MAGPCWATLRVWHVFIAEFIHLGMTLSLQATSFHLSVCHTFMGRDKCGPLLFWGPKYPKMQFKNSKTLPHGPIIIL